MLLIFLDSLFSYRNLDAFQGPHAQDILHHTVRIDSSRVPAVDSDRIPTGSFIDVTGSPLDFRTPENIGARINETFGLCGMGAALALFLPPRRHSS